MCDINISSKISRPKKSCADNADELYLRYKDEIAKLDIEIESYGDVTIDDKDKFDTLSDKLKIFGACANKTNAICKKQDYEKALKGLFMWLYATHKSGKQGPKILPKEICKYVLFKDGDSLSQAERVIMSLNRDDKDPVYAAVKKIYDFYDNYEYLDKHLRENTTIYGDWQNEEHENMPLVRAILGLLSEAESGWDDKSSEFWVKF